MMKRSLGSICPVCVSRTKPVMAMMCNVCQMTCVRASAIRGAIYNNKILSVDSQVETVQKDWEVTYISSNGLTAVKKFSNPREALKLYVSLRDAKMQGLNIYHKGKKFSPKTN